MTRRLKACLTCKPVPKEKRDRFTLPRGFTRHRNRICAPCRHLGPPTPAPDYRGRAA